jgi:hypothetical protein
MYQLLAELCSTLVSGHVEPIITLSNHFSDEL